MGGRGKGFHLAAVATDRSTDHAHVRHRSRAPELAARWVADREPRLVAVDSPAAWAPLGHSSRPCEREFARAGICGIRFTPSEEVAEARDDAYYEWIEHGLELWSELERRGLHVIECFPTASWTQWFGPREGSRAQWTRKALTTMGVATGLDVGEVRNQDQRDAVAAALTARQAGCRPDTVLHFGHLVAPCVGEVRW